MGNNYKRKRISNLESLDLEEAKIKKKLRRIEQEWVEILNPQQLAIGFLTNFISKKIAGKKASTDKKAGLFSRKPKTTVDEIPNPPLVRKASKSRWKTLIKIAGVGITALMVIKRINKNRKRSKLSPVVVDPNKHYSISR